MRLSDEQIARARQFPLADIVARDVPLKAAGRSQQKGCCPLHKEKTPSFFVIDDDRGGHFHCFGCGAHGDVIAYVMRTRRLEFAEAVKQLLGDLSAASIKPAQRKAESARDDSKLVEEILRGCGPVVEGTAAHLYLWSRRLATRQPGLLAHPGLMCVEARRPLPALVAPIVSSAGVVTGLQRIWCRDRFEATEKDGRAQLETRKKTIGVIGDGAVRLADVSDTLGLAEGVETACAAAALFKISTWAACGLSRFGSPPRDSALARPPSIWIPPSVRRLVIFGDRGEAGERGADFAAWWWRRQGLQASAIFPAEQFGDFADEVAA